MPGNMNKEIQTPDGLTFPPGNAQKESIKAAENKDTIPKDTISQLFDDRDRPLTEGSAQAKGKGASVSGTPPASPGIEAGPEAAREEAVKLDKLDDGVDEPPSQPSLPEAEVLRAKLEKTEKVLAENQRYGRNNAQKLKLALKAVQKFADDGALAEEEARELFGVLQSAAPEGSPGSEGEHAYAHPSQASHTNPFAPIFEIANKELQNIFKYTDDGLLQDKVNAFDYFLSVGSKEEIAGVLQDLTALMDDPVKLAKKMLSIGATVYEESWKGIKEAGGFKAYLANKEETVDKLQKKVDKLEKKLLQYEDFDKPRYRIDEMSDDGSDGSSPVKDTISALFEERDKVKRQQVKA